MYQASFIHCRWTASLGGRSCDYSVLRRNKNVPDSPPPLSFQRCTGALRVFFWFTTVLHHFLSTLSLSVFLSFCVLLSLMESVLPELPLNESADAFITFFQLVCWFVWVFFSRNHMRFIPSLYQTWNIVVCIISIMPMFFPLCVILFCLDSVCSKHSGSCQMCCAFFWVH